MKNKRIKTTCPVGMVYCEMIIGQSEIKKCQGGNVCPLEQIIKIPKDKNNMNKNLIHYVADFGKGFAAGRQYQAERDRIAVYEIGVSNWGGSIKFREMALAAIEYEKNQINTND